MERRAQLANKLSERARAARRGERARGVDERVVDRPVAQVRRGSGGLGVERVFFVVGGGNATRRAFRERASGDRSSTPSARASAAERAHRDVHARRTLQAPTLVRLSPLVRKAAAATVAVDSAATVDSSGIESALAASLTSSSIGRAPPSRTRR